VGKPLLVHVAASLSPALLNHVENSDEIVAGTVRPDEGNWRPHFLGTTRPETECVLHGHRPILAAALLLILILLAGCSAEVQVTTAEQTSPLPSADELTTAVAVDGASADAPSPKPAA